MENLEPVYLASCLVSRQLHITDVQQIKQRWKLKLHYFRQHTEGPIHPNH